jgi:integration host factor subunit alpha
MSFTKANLVDSICSHSGCSKTQSNDLMESILEKIKMTLETGEAVMISGFGKFCVKEKMERRGRNHQKGDVLMLGSRRIVIFKCSSVLKDKINVKG